MQQRRGCLFSLFGPLLALAVVYAVIAALDPWALHIGGRSTPLLMWRGSGKLVTKGGIVYPLYVSFYPSSHFSQLHLDGLRPTGGLQGQAWLCTSPGVSQRLRLNGTIYGGWRSTQDSLMAFRLNEPQIIKLGQRQGFFDLYGRWHGPTLVMDDRGRVGGTFGSGLRIDHASVSLDWGSYSDFKAACAAASYPARR
jgi:hypothetical protein